MDRWEYYNPNPAGNRVGDCAVRAICKATGFDWETVFAGLMIQEQERFLIISAMKKFLTFRLKTMTSDVLHLRTVRVHCSQLQWLLRHSSLLMRLIQHRSRHIRFLTRTHFMDADATPDAIADNFILRVSFD